MIGNISDIIIVLIVGVLLIGGEKNAPQVMRNLGKAYEEFRRRQSEFTAELNKELKSIDDIRNEGNQELIKQISYTPQQQSYSYNNKISQLEEEIKRLQSELERLKKDGNKN
ncbi:Sec-independent protein translocase subunit TatA/TatB [Acidianus manzaensis]|uniref:Sec-independent protein translocase subunit TatA/TatB n=1 Tax=Acidianus manzaensis TaxID=282676 RepID=UPI00164FF1D5|nr:twin-arginine translocase TatA/TatE family subunit [Acidianus manzaensis]